MPIYDKTLSDQELFEMNTEFDVMAEALNKKINEASLTKSIVFIYHSFGTYVFASYY